MVLLDTEVAGSSAIRPQVVSDQPIGDEAVFLEQLAHELRRGMLVLFRLDQDIEDLAAYFSAIEISVGKLPGG